MRGKIKEKNHISKSIFYRRKSVDDWCPLITVSGTLPVLLWFYCKILRTWDIPFRSSSIIRMSDHCMTSIEVLTLGSGPPVWITRGIQCQDVRSFSLMLTGSYSQCVWPGFTSRIKFSLSFFNRKVCFKTHLTCCSLIRRNPGLLKLKCRESTRPSSKKQVKWIICSQRPRFGVSFYLCLFSLLFTKYISSFTITRQ